MADKKKDLAAMLGGETPKPAIRRGQGVRLSTETTPAAETQERDTAASQSSEIAETQKRRNAETQKRNAGPKRVNRGYSLREDLIKEFKLIAVREDRNLYEVMEEALEQYLARRQEA
jgi:hypothetical protein